MEIYEYFVIMQELRIFIITKNNTICLVLDYI